MTGKLVYRFTVAGRLCGLNEFIAAGHSKFGGNRVKREAEALITSFLPKRRPEIKYPVWVSIDYYEPSNRRDHDNVQFAIKFIMDAMVKAGMLINDTRKYVLGSTPKVRTDKDNPRIEVSVHEAEESQLG